MIDFSLTEEQIALKKMAQRFREKEITPIAAKLDSDVAHKINWEIIRKLAANDFLRMAVREKHGGLGLDYMSQAIILEELAVGCIAIAMIAGWNLGSSFFYDFGTEEQQDKFLPPICDKNNPRLIVLAATESHAGSDLGRVSTKAVLDKDEYVINGTKCFITHANYSHLIITLAVTDKTKGTKGMSTLIVPADTPGVSIGKIEDKMGARAAHSVEVIYKDVRIPKENLLGKEGQGFAIALNGIGKVRPLITGSLGVGVARAAFECALKYSKEREQFGKPIFANQAVSFMLADMAIKIETARMLVWKACWELDNNLPYEKSSAMAKIYPSDIAMAVTTDAVQILGGYGYMKDFPVEKYMRDAKVLQIYEGTNQILRVLLGRFL
jgi:alkylation response protein AidB-like acyl-CoA dehydrogenase